MVGVNGTAVESADDYSKLPTTPLGAIRRRFLSIDFEEEAPQDFAPPSAAEKPSPA